MRVARSLVNDACNWGLPRKRDGVRSGFYTNVSGGRFMADDLELMIIVAPSSIIISITGT
jgi:hypothetical protein